MRLLKILYTLPIFLSVPLTASADWREINDSITKAVKELKPPVGPYTLTVDYKEEGLITLSGHVSSAEDKIRIEKIAAATGGVESVTNHLDVIDSAVPTLSRARPMSPAAQAVSNAFATKLINVKYDVAVEEVNSGLALTGTVDTDETRQRVVEVARSASKLPIIDKLTLAAPKPDPEILALVQAELTKQYPALAEQVKVVSVNSGVVTVSGNLKDHWDIDRVLAAIVMVNGVKDISSQISINGVPYNSKGSIPQKK